LALLTENGPCSVNDDGKTTSVNPYSWTEAAHVLWLDQPAGVGFSYGTENDYNEDMIAEDAYYFLQAFFQTYPQYSKNPFFIVAESYGGHYAPAIANRILQGNHRIPNDNESVDSNSKDGDKLIKINLSGVGLGNGLTMPEEQYKWYPEMGHNNSHGIQVFNDEVYQGMLDVVPKCTSLIHKCNEGDSMIDDFACQSAFLLCNMGLTSPYQATGLNPYDIRIPCAVPPLCYDMSHIDHWFHLESTKKALGVDEKHSHAWTTCNFGINMKFHQDWMKDFSPDVANVLNANIPVLVYAGDVDFICNYLGNKAWSYNLEWKGKAYFQAAVEHEYGAAADGTGAAGLARTTPDGLFTFLQVYDAGHMVPSDQPQVALEMIRNFVTRGKF
jgi:cathepsin A (carboxypeptidase C)